ncbi:MAG: CDP-diacylglycerol--glycerol-3-phosphate 3-phosphatidyltransferase [Gammaproteobacteria bacterium]
MTNIVNLITFSRILLAPIILAFLMLDNFLICLLLFIVAGISDYFDGYLARRYNAVSQLGEILDPIADKILVIFILFGLSVHLHSYLIAFLGSIILTREIGVVALRDYSSRNNISNKMKVTFLAKTKTAIQMQTLITYLLALTLKLNLLLILSDILLIIATLITLYTGYEYAENVFKK